MNENHPSFEELTDLFYESEDGNPSPRKEHVEHCAVCRREYESVRRFLQTLQDQPVPDLSPAERTQIFERAWSERRNRQSPAARGFIHLWAWLRKPALTFALGIGCGLAFAGIAMKSEPPVAPVGNAARPAIRVDTYDATQTIQGEAVKKMYPFLENPILVVGKKSQESEEPHHVLYGTAENGSIQIVLNL